MDLKNILIPEFSHSTVQQILEINKHLIELILEYQNNGSIYLLTLGWLEEAKVYHSKLISNLVFLSCFSNAAQKSRFNPKLNGVIKPIKTKIPSTKAKIIESLDLPIMLRARSTSTDIGY